MNEDMCRYIIDLHNKKTFIEEWLKYRYKEKSLYISGNPGIGKTTIANYILKDWVKIYVKSDLCKTNICFEDFIKDSLYKKSITMMFDSNTYKALIIDDIFYIQNNDKKLFKSILNFSKNKITNHPIIYIFNNINHKNLKLIIKKSYPFKIELNEKQMINITNKYLIKKKLKNDIIKELIKKSNYNFHNIIVNINFYKGGDFTKIKECDIYNNELSEHIKYVFNKKNISDIYDNSYSDYNIIGLNILENFPQWIKKLNNQKKTFISDKIYELLSISEVYSQIIHENNNWNYIDNIITCNIVYPIVILKRNDVKIDSLIYNKYISKCIIYIHNYKLLNSLNLNIHKLYILYNMIDMYYNSDKNKIILLQNILNYINHYRIPINITEKFIKYFLKEIDKNKIKIFYNL